MYAALMFDVIGSRKYEDRFLVQEILMESVNYLNNCYKENVVKEVISSAGDEFQGLFDNIEVAYVYVRKLQLLVYPIKIRCGIGCGNIKYNKSEWSSAATDGTAYYLARDAIDEIKDKKDNSICFNTGSKYDRYLNILCEASMGVKREQSWMEYMIELVADVLMPIGFCREEKTFYGELLSNREKLLNSENSERMHSAYKVKLGVNIDIELLFNLRCCVRDIENKTQKFYYTEFWSRGMIKEMAEVMGMTRQNVARYVLRGKIKESRTMDKQIKDLLEENIW